MTHTGLTNGSANMHLLWGGGGLCALKFYDFQSLRGLDMGKRGEGKWGKRGEGKWGKEL